MPKYRATTETGRQYLIDTDETLWVAVGTGYGGEILEFKIGERDYSDVRRTLTELMYDTEAPEVDREMYLRGPGLHNWRLSTRVETVEVLDNE